MANIRRFKETSPNLGNNCYIDDSAVVIGDVTLGEDSSIWPMAVARGDVNRIVIGSRSNVQDGCVIHVTRRTKNNPDGWPTLIGDEVTIGHSVTLHGCKINKHVLVGNCATVLDGAEIEEQVIVGANALVPPGKKLESGFLYLGSPCKPARPLTEKEIAFFSVSADNYVRLKNDYLEQQ